MNFYSYSREFDLRYVFVDFIALFIWLSYIYRSGWKYCILRGLVIGAICYYIDAVVWHNTPLRREDDDRKGEEEDDLLFQRTWQFECSNGIFLTRPTPTRAADAMSKCKLFGFLLDLDDAYRILKAVCDFMMTWSYSLIWFTWESIVMSCHIEKDNSKDNKKLIYWYSSVAFTLNFLIYPLSLLITAGHDVRIVATRYMHDDERAWLAYAVITNVLLFMYNVKIRKYSIRETIRDTVFCWTVGSFQAFAMICPLYLFRIRPVFEVSRFLYELAFLMNRGSAEHYLGCCLVISLRQRWTSNKCKAKEKAR